MRRASVVVKLPTLVPKLPKLTGTLSLTLPYPPSVNNLHRRVVIKGRARTLLSKPAREYYRDVRVACRSQGMAGRLLLGRLRVCVWLHPPDGRKRDISNTIKAIEDALTHARVWQDDSLVDHLTLIRCDPKPLGEVRVEIVSTVA